MTLPIASFPPPHQSGSGGDGGGAAGLLREREPLRMLGELTTLLSEKALRKSSDTHDGRCHILQPLIESITALLKPSGFKVYNPPGDGHCLLRCYLCAVYGEAAASNDSRVASLRRRIAGAFTELGEQCLDYDELLLLWLENCDDRDERWAASCEENPNQERLLLKWRAFCRDYGDFRKAKYSGETVLSVIRSQIHPETDNLIFIIVSVSERNGWHVLEKKLAVRGTDKLSDDHNAVFLIYLTSAQHFCLVTRQPEHPLADNRRQQQQQPLLPKEVSSQEPEVTKLPTGPAAEGQTRGEGGRATLKQKAGGKMPVTSASSGKGKQRQKASRKSKTHLTISAKLEVLKARAAGATIAAVSKRFGVSKRTVVYLVTQKNGIEQKNLNSRLRGTKNLKANVKFPVLETAVQAFVELMRRERFPVTARLIQSQALAIAADLGIAEYDFKASDNWAARFVKRMGLTSKTLHGEAGSARGLDVSDAIRKLRKELDGYSVEHIYNMDETGLFYRLLPKKSYICMDEDKRSVRGTKMMKAKDRISLYVCTNAAGTHKLPMGVIGKSANPRILGKGATRTTLLKDLRLNYFSQSNAWSDTKTMLDWLREVFLPQARRHAKGAKIALIMDNCGPHLTKKRGEDGEEVPVLPDLEDCKFLFLPPNVTSIHQPMDQGVIALTKRAYRYRLLIVWGKVFRYRLQLQNTSKQMKRGTKGIQEGSPPHLLDAITILSDVWRNSLTKEAIIRCWLKSDILPAAHQKALTKEVGDDSARRGGSRRRVIPDLLSDQQTEQDADDFDSSSVPTATSGSPAKSQGHLPDTVLDMVKDISTALGDMAKAELLAATEKKKSSNSAAAATLNKKPEVEHRDEVGECLLQMAQLSVKDQEETVLRWLNLEADPEISEAIVNDGLEEIKARAIKEVNQHGAAAASGGNTSRSIEDFDGCVSESKQASDNDEDTSGGEEKVTSATPKEQGNPPPSKKRQPMPSSEQFLAVFETLEGYLVSCGVSDQLIKDTHKLRYSILSERDAIEKEEEEAKKVQVRITSFFSRP